VRWFRWLERGKDRFPRGEVYIEPDFDPDVAREARSLAARIAAETDDEATYWSATDLHGLAGINLADKVPTPMYLIWAVLTDAWELHPERRAQTAQQMREAAADLANADSPAAVEEYFSKWCKRLGISRATVGRPR
jgi:hypothetical protein